MRLFRRRAAADTRGIRYWENLIARLGLPGVTVRDVIRTEGGYQVHCRFRRRQEITPGQAGGLASQLAVHKRLPRAAVSVEVVPAGRLTTDVIICVPVAASPSLAGG